MTIRCSIFYTLRVLFWLLPVWCTIELTLFFYFAVTGQEGQLSQVDGAWEEDKEDDLSELEASAQGVSSAGNEEEELHTPKLSQRGLQLRAQMMKYGLSIAVITELYMWVLRVKDIFRQDSEGRYLCFFNNCTMRMTTNFSRHIAKHEKKLDAISPDLVHLLKEGASVEKYLAKQIFTPTFL